MPDTPLDVKVGGKSLSAAARKRINEALRKTLEEELKKEGHTLGAKEGKTLGPGAAKPAIHATIHGEIGRQEAKA